MEEQLPEGVYALGACDPKTGESALMIVNTGLEERAISGELAPVCTHLVDETHDYAKVEYTGVLPKESVMLLDFVSPS